MSKLRRFPSDNGYHSIGDDGLADELREMVNNIVVQIIDIANEYRDLESRIPADQYQAWLQAEYGRDVSDDVMQLYDAVASGDHDRMVNAYLEMSVTYDPKTGYPYPSPLVRALTRAA